MSTRPPPASPLSRRQPEDPHSFSLPSNGHFGKIATRTNLQRRLKQLPSCSPALRLGSTIISSPAVKRVRTNALYHASRATGVPPALAVPGLGLQQGARAGRPDPNPTPVVAGFVAGGASGVLVGAGDIGYSGSPGAEATGRLLDRFSGTVFTAGDNAYMSGTSAEYQSCYVPGWGRHLSRTRPAVGNHDNINGGAGYYQFFGASAGLAGVGYYSYVVGPVEYHRAEQRGSVGRGFRADDVVAQRAVHQSGQPAPRCTGIGRCSALAATATIPTCGTCGARSTSSTSIWSSAVTMRLRTLRAAGS